MLGAWLDRLEAHYGVLAPPHPTGAVDLLLWDNVAYLVDDARRAAAFGALTTSVGCRPEAILDASDADLLAVVAGMQPAGRVSRLRQVAELALALDLVPDPAPVLRQPLPQARRILRQFPGIGEPGADRILLFGRHHRVLPLDSNALRVLLRLGVGEETGNYQRSYRSAQAAARRQLDDDFSCLIRANLLLRRHGLMSCRRTQPECSKCPVASECPFAGFSG